MTLRVREDLNYQLNRGPPPAVDGRRRSPLILTFSPRGEKEYPVQGDRRGPLGHFRGIAPHNCGYCEALARGPWQSPGSTWCGKYLPVGAPATERVNCSRRGAWRLPRRLRCPGNEWGQAPILVCTPIFLRFSRVIDPILDRSPNSLTSRHALGYLCYEKRITGIVSPPMYRGEDLAHGKRENDRDHSLPA